MKTVVFLRFRRNSAGFLRQTRPESHKKTDTRTGASKGRQGLMLVAALIPIANLTSYPALYFDCAQQQAALASNAPH
jgi:hypothetical protein